MDDAQEEPLPSVRFVLDDQLRVHDVAVLHEGSSVVDLQSILGKPMVDLVVPAHRERLGAALHDALGGSRERVPARLSLHETSADYLLHVAPGERFIHVSAEPGRASLESGGGSGSGRDSESGIRLEYIGMVASRISHDFKNLLAAILVNAEYLRREEPDPAAVQEVAEEILMATERARELIRQILGHAGSKAEPRSVVELNGLTEEMGRLLEISTPPTVVLRYDLEAGIPSVIGQPLRLRQLMLSFIVNAAEAIGEQVGAIMVSTSMVDADDALLSRTRTRTVPPAGTYVCLEVEDTGPGLDAETAREIFDPFFSTKKDGHGLGLSASLAAVEEHGGALLLDSAPGQGARFRVLIPPADEAEAEAESLLPDGVDRRFDGRVVLIIDDDDLVRSVTRRALQSRGFEVLTAHDGLQGIETFDEEHARIDAVLLDMGMPYMKGSDVFEELRSIDDSVPLVFVSGQSEAELHRSGAVAEAVVFKPFRDDDLVSALAKVMDLVGPD